MDSDQSRTKPTGVVRVRPPTEGANSGTGSAADQQVPESLREILEAPVVSELVTFLREANQKQIDLAKRQADRSHELSKQQLELREIELKRQHDFERARLELTSSHARSVRWIVIGILLGVAGLFAFYRDKPEIAIDVSKGLAALGGMFGAGWAFSRRATKPSE